MAALVTATPSVRPGSGPCSEAPFRQFDFFVGDWDAYEVTAPAQLVAHNRVTIVLAGCVLHEVYEQQDGLVGESFSLYDAARGVWHQSWVTNRGTLLLLDGGLQGDSMVLTATERAADGTTSLLRGVWHPERDAVREMAVRSRDGGRTWEPVFDMKFRPHGHGAPR